jgi:uncharacterized protein (TIGR02145 family)
LEIKQHLNAMRFALFFALLLAALSFMACGQSFTDPRDGQAYKIVQIGNVTWFAQNLNYETDGSTCPEGDSRNCEKYGRLYTWEVAQNVCPEGWLLPDSLDFAKLVEQAGGPSQAGDALKATDGWFKKGNGSDAFGFKALPAGYRGAVYEGEGGAYDGIGGYAYFWSATETLDGLAYYLFLDFSSKAANLNAFGKGDFRSVRCIKKP